MNNIKIRTWLVLGTVALVDFILLFVAFLLYMSHEWQCDDGWVVVFVWEDKNMCVDPELLRYNGTCSTTWRPAQIPLLVRSRTDSSTTLFQVAVWLMVLALLFSYSTDPAFRRR
jgi:hypothetical protein